MSDQERLLALADLAVRQASRPVESEGGGESSPPSEGDGGTAVAEVVEAPEAGPSAEVEPNEASLDSTEPRREVPTLHVPIVRSELSCGAELLVSPREDAPVTAIQVHFRGGPSLDPEGQEGTAYLVGALADQGTKLRSEEQIALELESAGGQISGDATGLSGNIASARWKLLCDVLADLLKNATFPNHCVARQKTRIGTKLLVDADDPRSQSQQRFRKLVYGDHWLGRPAYGTLESLTNIEPKHLRAFHRKNWVAKRAVIAVCGNVDPKAVKRQLNRLLKDWKSGRDLPPKDVEFPKKRVRADAFFAKREQVHLFLGHLGIRRSDPDYAALVVMDHILGTGPGFTNRISGKLRDELGLAYTVTANIHGSAGILPGMFTAYIGTSPEHVPTAIDGFLDEIRRIRTELVSAEELRVARDYLVGSFSMGFQRASRRAGYLVSVARHNLPDNHLETLPRRFGSVTAEEVRDVAARHLDPENVCVSAGGPIKKKDLLAMIREKTR